MTAPDDGLVCVVGGEVEATPDEDSGEYVAGGCDTLAGLAPNCHSEVIHSRTHASTPSSAPRSRLSDTHGSPAIITRMQSLGLSGLGDN